MGKADICYCKVNWDKSYTWWLFCDKSTSCIKIRLNFMASRYRNWTNKLAYCYRKRLYTFIFVCGQCSSLSYIYATIPSIYWNINNSNSLRKPDYLSIHWSNIFYGNIYIGIGYSFVRWLFVFGRTFGVSLGAFKKFRSVNLLIYNGLFDKLKCVMCIVADGQRSLCPPPLSCSCSRPRSRVESSTMV